MESAGRWLRDVEVRPVRGVEKRRRWDALMARHHYLPFHGLFGKSLRHVAVRGETWLALLWRTVPLRRVDRVAARLRRGTLDTFQCRHKRQTLRPATPPIGGK